MLQMDIDDYDGKMVHAEFWMKPEADQNCISLDAGHKNN